MTWLDGMRGIRCDADALDDRVDCAQRFRGGGPANDQRRDARAAGWWTAAQTGGPRDLCPDHAPREHVRVVSTPRLPAGTDLDDAAPPDLEVPTAEPPT